MKKVQIFVLILATLFLAFDTTQKTVQIPPIKLDEDISLRLNELIYIEKPDFRLKNIYKREIYKINNQSITNFEPCFQTTPQISFKIINYYSHSDLIKKQSIVYNFEQLKSSRNILDIAYTGNHIVTVSSHGAIQIMQLDKTSSQFKNLQTLRIKQKYLDMGYLVQLKQEALIFFNSQVAIKINPSSQYVKEMSGYEIHEKFQTAIAISQQLVAVADRQNGVFLYKVQNSTLNKVNSIDKSNFGSLFASSSSKLSISDLAYNKQKNNLIVLDEQKGVFVFKLSFKQNNVLIQLDTSMINKKACNVVHLDPVNQFLYLSCNQISKINLKNWPIYQQKLLPHPLISIKQIITTPNNLLGLIGNNVFKLFYFDRPVDYFQDDMLEKLIFKDGVAITSNQNYMMALTYQLIPPKIQCQTSNTGLLGNHHIILKTTAQCNSIFLNYVGYISGSNLTQSDVCVYTFFQNMYIWEVGRVPLTIITVVFVLMILFVIASAFYMIVIRFRSKNAEKQLQALGVQSGHQVLVQQDVKDHSQSSNPNLNDQKQAQQPNKNLYSIE